MQPRPDPPPARGDEDSLDRQHHRKLRRAIARQVTGSPELIEDACQYAWLKLVDTQPVRDPIFAWLYIVALHEACRLSAGERCEVRLEHVGRDDATWDDVIADQHTVETAHDALEALRAVAALPDPERIDFALNVAGYSYEEIRTFCCFRGSLG